MKYIKYIGYCAASVVLSFAALYIVGLIAGIVAKGFTAGFNLW